MADKFAAHWLWKETANKLTSFEQRVQEGQDLDAAIEFARYLIWSKLDKLLAPFDCQGELKVDSQLLISRAKNLQEQVQEIWRSGKAGPHANEPQYEAILKRLDLIASHVSRISPPVNSETAEAGPPDLQVIHGGGQ